jgi:hypothetical protein
VHNNCAGRVTLNNMKLVKLIDHNHVPNPEELISIELRAKINKRAETSADAPQKIIHEALLDVHSVTRVRWFNVVFQTGPVPVKYVMPALGFGMLWLILDELRKWCIRKYPRDFWAKIAW